MQETKSEFIDAKLFTPDDFTREGGLWLVRIGQNIAKPNYVSGPRALEHYSIHFIMDGKVELNHGLNRFVLSKGDSFCMFPGIIYRYRYVQSDRPLSMIWISFDGTQSSTLLTRTGFHESAPFLRQVITNELKHTIQNLFMISTEGVRGQLQLQSLLYSIFSHMILSDESAISSEGFTQWVSNSIEYMKVHYTEGITVQDVAANASLHRAYFSKIFTQQIGISPKQYLEKLKMEKSLELLRSTRYTINEISLTLGYSDPYTFTHAFSRYHGIPPGKWRAVRSGR
jgi:AraC-like DNA-binding protein